jgi:hypothetical protein
LSPRVAIEVKVENMIISAAGKALMESPELRGAVVDIAVQRATDDPNFAAGRLMGGVAINALIAEASVAANGVRLNSASKTAAGFLTGVLGVSGDAREMAHQGVTNPVALAEGAIFGDSASSANTQQQEKVTCTGSRIERASC